MRTRAPAFSSSPASPPSELPNPSTRMRTSTPARASVPFSIEVQRIPASINGIRSLIVFEVTTPAPVFKFNPGILYLAVITH